MIDFCTYEIQQDEETGKFHLSEKLEPREMQFDNISQLIRYIEEDLRNLEWEVKV